MDLENKARIIVILGMHRSGTSAVTRCLSSLGITVGEELVPASFDNPTGFWEDKDFVAFNEKLLSRLNNSYESVALIDYANINENLSEFKLEAIQLIRKKISLYPAWLLKDPRICKLLPFWKLIFDHLNINVDYVIVVRNPISVADSLKARNKFPLQKSLWLWFEHYVFAVNQTHNDSRVVVDYDKFLVNPYTELGRLASYLKFPIDCSSDENVKEVIENFLSLNMRHSQYEANDLKHVINIPVCIINSYDSLMSATSNMDILYSDEFKKQWHGFEEQLNNFAPTLQFIYDLDYLGIRQSIEINELSERFVRLDSEKTCLNETILDKTSEIENLTRELVDRNINNAKLLDLLAELEAETLSQNKQLESYTTQLSSRDQLIEDFNEKIVKLISGNEVKEHEYQQALEELNEQVANLNKLIQDKEIQFNKFYETIAKQKSSYSWKISAPLRLLEKTIIYLYQTIKIINHAIYLGGGYIGTTKLLISVLRKQGFQGVIWRLGNAKSFLNRQPILQSEDLNGQQIDSIHLPKSNHFVPLLKGKPVTHKPVKLICFYLPQFHAIPENDAWWGEGFTEWTNVQPAQPQFAGHYQPHIPGELGYYNLLNPEVQRRQIELAKLYGIEGFCFYFYWFGGKRLLETPLQNYLNDKSLDLPFCLCWANENWSRRWDGRDSELLIAQQHSPEDDIAFIQHIARYLRDERYIKINGKPLLVVYHPSLLPSAKATAKRWRKWCLDNGIGEIYLAYTQSFVTLDPAQFGFDAAIEFPPNNSAPPTITEAVTPLRCDFEGIVYDWNIFLERSERYSQSNYKLFRSVCLDWDNTARRKSRGAVFLNSSPDKYQQWLKNAINYTTTQFSESDERLVFINAWNEWAEGAHLEPDQRYGYAYLQATRNALTGVDEIPTEQRRIVLVTHDAHPHGAQLLALNLVKTLNQGFGFQVDLVCLGNGLLKTSYAKWANIHDLSGINPQGVEAQNLAKKLYAMGHRNAILNTTVSGLFLKTLSEQGFDCIALIHELAGVLKQMHLDKQAKTIASYANKIVFPAQTVADSFNKVALCASEKVIIRPQGLYKRCGKQLNSTIDRHKLRQSLGISDDALIILGVGYADHRKGIDLFVKAGLEMLKQHPKAYWVWIGHWAKDMQGKVESLLNQFPAMKKHFIFPGIQENTDFFYAGADVFALTSREDPFPSVVLEALDAGIPVVAFKEASGVNNLLLEGCGVLVAKENYKAFAKAISHLLVDVDIATSMGQKGKTIIDQRFSFRHYIFDLLAILGVDLKKITVVVPNYNYAHYLPQRLSTIINQSYPIYEIIFLDDCSSDNSVDVASRLLETQEIDYKIIINQYNSGSVFSQWKKGVDLALGDYVWLAEADDYSDNNFLHETMHAFRTPGVVLSYCESKQVDEQGHVLANNYWEYIKDIDPHYWITAYVRDGIKEVVNALSIKNTIPNVSGVLFNKNKLQIVLDEHIELIRSYRVAGDWLVYVLLLADGKLAFTPKALNMHRRHINGVTIGAFNEKQLDEIKQIQSFVSINFIVPDEIRVIANAYIDKLVKQFDL